MEDEIVVREVINMLIGEYDYEMDMQERQSRLQKRKQNCCYVHLFRKVCYLSVKQQWKWEYRRKSFWNGFEKSMDNPVKRVKYC